MTLFGFVFINFIFSHLKRKKKSGSNHLPNSKLIESLLYPYFVKLAKHSPKMGWARVCIAVSPEVVHPCSTLGFLFLSSSFIATFSRYCHHIGLGEDPNQSELQQWWVRKFSKIRSLVSLLVITSKIFIISSIFICCGIAGKQISFIRYLIFG